MGRVVAWALAALAVVLLPLAIPPGDAVIPDPPPGAAPFAWGRDSLWRSLEARFREARGAVCADSAAARVALQALDRIVEDLPAAQREPVDPAFDRAEAALFAVAPSAAACPALAAPYAASVARFRDAVKLESIGWDVNARASRDRLYRAIYGGRAALEEVMLQQPGPFDALLRGVDEPSATPAAESHGVVLHSGDMLLSRGGYPTSALIARGNDYPGNFSHVALVHVDSATRAITVIEAHIELGVALATADQYLADKKLRVLVLRPRADLPALRADPQLPHKAATAALARARAGHVPYDFAMDYTDPSRLFCSEVASSAYATQGLTLWMGISTISRPGLRQWLGSFGVRHFATQEPSDLEYDPQLRVVAEWRDPATLFGDHVDNAVTDAMLEGADRGDRLGFPWYQLPLARLLKGYSVVLERTGRVGPVPEGMAPAAALRNRGYGARHAALADTVRARAAAWEAAQGYRPPYWVLVDLARGAVSPP